MPFRDAHAVIGRLVLYCVKDNKGLLDLSLDELKGFSELFEEDVYDACSMHACVTLRDVPGGPAPNRVRETIEAGEKFLAEFVL
jgi:argininosuccinate lyase